MEAFTTLVNVNEETSLLLVNYISTLLNEKSEEVASSFLSECSELIDQAETVKLITKILSFGEVLFEADMESDTEGCFQAIISIMFSLPPEEDDASNKIVSLIIETLVCNTETKQQLRLKILVSIFNMLVSVESKFNVLKALLKYANATGLSPLVSKYHGKIDDWIMLWGLSVPQSRVLYQLVLEAEAVRGAIDQENSSAVVFLVKYLKTFAGESYPEEVQTLTTSAVISAIRSPISSYQDRSKLYEALSKQNLGSSLLSTLVELLRILCNDSLDAYLAFRAIHPEVFSTASSSSSGNSPKISHDEILHSMRLLTLSSLGAQEKTLSYDKIAGALKIDIAEVEEWVVEAIANGLMEASMDQFESTVQITRCVNRSFDLTQWRLVQQKLHLWRKNVTSIVDSLKKHSE